ncbi:MAG: dimethylarginine dimethylhydrolase, eukaryotic [Thermoleophilaceae bacterium]|nr:dimethylarginine dimethylhydrolase, eukaryotic [Thermoleophilaceae bacterium]
MVVGDVVITGPISHGLARRIAARGFEVESLDLSEFYKAGGGAKCLTLPLWPLGADPSADRPGGHITTGRLGRRSARKSPEGFDAIERNRARA